LFSQEYTSFDANDDVTLKVHFSFDEGTGNITNKNLDNNNGNLIYVSQYIRSITT